MADIENPLFEAYLESLGIPRGDDLRARWLALEAMYHAAYAFSGGWEKPVFPISRLRDGWIGWLVQEMDTGGGGEPMAMIATRCTSRTHAQRHVARFEASAPNGLDVVEPLLRFGRRWKDDERDALVRGFVHAIRLDPEEAASTLGLLSYCEQLCLSKVKAESLSSPRRWRKLAKDLGV